RQSLGFLFTALNFWGWGSGGRECRVSMGVCGIVKKEGGGGGGGSIASVWSGRPHRSSSRRTFRRSATAGGDRARVGEQPAGDSRRRAHWRSRQQKRRRGLGTAQRASRRGSNHHPYYSRRKRNAARKPDRTHPGRPDLGG